MVVLGFESVSSGAQSVSGSFAVRQKRLAPVVADQVRLQRSNPRFRRRCNGRGRSRQACTGAGIIRCQSALHGPTRRQGLERDADATGCSRSGRVAVPPHSACLRSSLTTTSKNTEKNFNLNFLVLALALLKSRRLKSPPFKVSYHCFTVGEEKLCPFWPVDLGLCGD